MHLIAVAKKFFRLFVALLPGPFFAVRAVLAGGDELHGSARERFAHAVHFARFGAGIETSVKKQHRHLELAQPPVIQILVRPPHAVSDSKPDRTVAAQHRWPARFTMIVGEHPARFVAQLLWMRREAFEKGSRTRFPPQEVKSLQNHSRTAFRRDQPHHRGDYRTVAVTPQDGALDAECVEKTECLERGSAV